MTNADTETGYKYVANVVEILRTVACVQRHCSGRAPGFFLHRATPWYDHNIYLDHHQTPLPTSIRNSPCDSGISRQWRWLCSSASPPWSVLSQTYESVRQQNYGIMWLWVVSPYVFMVWYLWCDIRSMSTSMSLCLYLISYHWYHHLSPAYTLPHNLIIVYVSVTNHEFTYNNI